VDFRDAHFVPARFNPPSPPLVRENDTVKISQHVHVMPDRQRPMVPNVGIVVGSRAVLVVDPDMGRQGGAAVLREVAKLTKSTEIYTRGPRDEARLSRLRHIAIAFGAVDQEPEDDGSPRRGAPRARVLRDDGQLDHRRLPQIPAGHARACGRVEAPGAPPRI